MRSSPALSLTRIEVVHKTGSVLVSPKDRAAFIRAIKRVQPTLVLEGVLESAGQTDGSVAG
jgi:hypothetical protein